MSSTEAKYISASDSCRELLFLGSLISELTGLDSFSSPIVLHCNNQSTICIALNGLFYARIKHINIRYHFIRKAVENELVEPVYLPTNEMVADVFIKALVRSRIRYLVAELRLAQA